MHAHTVELVVCRFLVALDVKDLFDFYFFAEQLRQEAFKDVKIGFIAKHFFHRPVKVD
jgi:hypothetical protein